MRIYSVTRARFKKNGAVVRAHTINFETRERARNYVRTSKSLDSLNKVQFDWKYKTVSSHTY